MRSNEIERCLASARPLRGCVDAAAIKDAALLQSCCHNPMIGLPPLRPEETMGSPTKQEGGANLIMLPGKAGQPPSLPQRYPTMFEAIGHVMEVLPVAQHGGAVIQTSTSLLFFAEI